MEFGFLLFYFSLIRTTYQKPPSVFVSKVFIYWHVAHCLKFLISHISYLRFLIANKKMYHKKRAQEQLRGTWGVERTSAPISTGNSQKLTVVFEMHSLHHTHTQDASWRRRSRVVGALKLALGLLSWRGRGRTGLSTRRQQVPRPLRCRGRLATAGEIVCASTLVLSGSSSLLLFHLVAVFILVVIVRVHHRSVNHHVADD